MFYFYKSNLCYSPKLPLNLRERKEESTLDRDVKLARFLLNRDKVMGCSEVVFEILCVCLFILNSLLKMCILH